MVKKEEVLEKLKTVMDPELNVNIVDLGLIYNVQIVQSKEQKLRIQNSKLQINPNIKNKNSKEEIASSAKQNRNDKAFDVYITMTLTTPGCPLSYVFEELIIEAVGKIKGVKNVNVELVWEPMWTPDNLTDEAKETLGILR